MATKRKYISEEDAREDEYAEVECPDCGAPLTLRFARGRRSRRTTCPACSNKVTVALGGEPAEQELVRIARPDTRRFPPAG